MVSQLLCFCSEDEDICLFRLNHVSKDSLIDDRVHLEVGAHISVNSHPQWKKIIWSWTLQLVLYSAAGPGLCCYSWSLPLVHEPTAGSQLYSWSWTSQLVQDSAGGPMQMIFITKSHQTSARTMNQPKQFRLVCAHKEYQNSQ